MGKKPSFEIPLEDSYRLQELSKILSRISIRKNRKRGVAIIKAWERDATYLALLGIKTARI